MKYKILYKGISCAVLLIICFNNTVQAQEIRVEEPLSMIKSIDSDDPLRYYYPADPGIPGGDINGDGVQEHIVHNTLYPDKSTPETGDFIDNTLIYNIDSTGAISYYSIRDGVLFNPAGDLNGDGRDELAAVIDGSLKIYTFGTGEFDISGDLNLLFETDVSVNITQFVPGFDLDGDGNNDLLLGTYDFTDGSFFHIVFGGSTSEEFEFQSIDTSVDIGDLETKVNAGDLVGDDGDEIVLLTSTQWPYKTGAAVYEVDEARNITFTDSAGLGTAGYGANSMRYYIGNLDGENKDDIFFSEDRYNAGRGFTQVFFNDPISYFYLSLPPDTSAGSSKVNSEGTIPDWAEKTGAFGIGGATTLGGLNGLAVRTYVSPQFGLVATFGVDISIPEPELLETEKEDDYYFQTPYSPVANSGDVVVGVGNRNDWTAGKAVYRPTIINESYELYKLAFWQRGHLSLIFSEFAETRAAPAITDNSGTDVLIGLGIMGEWFPTQYLSLFAQADIRLDFFGEDDEEISSPTNEEPIGSLIANGLLGVNTSIGTDLLGAEGLTVWFNKANPTAVDTAQLVHSFKVTDFQDFGENDDPSVFMSNIGDINNDGYDDLLMSSGNSYSNGLPVNKAWLFYGGETYSTMPDYTFDFSQDSSIANTYSAFITTKMEPLGDVNGDGIDDFALSVNGFDNTGAVYIYYGDDQFFSTEAQQTEFRYPDLILTPDDVEGQTITSFGKDISSGDFDGDGELDIAVIHSGYGTPSPALIQIFTNDGDSKADIFLTTTQVPLGKEGSANVSTTYFGSIIFLPKEDGKAHQDLLFTPGGFSGYPNAIIFEGGAETDSLPDIILNNPNKYTGFGSIGGFKPGVGDINGDGFYDIMMLSQADYEDAFVSSRVYMFSPNADIDVSSSEQLENPFEYRLSQNYPNPFNPTTKIEFRLGSASPVILTVFDVLGRKVATLINGEAYTQGSHTINFDASRLASGIYLYKLEAGGFSQTRKMMLIK